MRKVLWLLIVLLFPIGSAWSQLPINTNIFRKSIVFLYAATTDANNKVIPDVRHPLGTGFLVLVPLNGEPPENPRGYVLLVTARHVVDPEWAYCPVVNPKKIFVRINKTNYDAAKKESGVTFGSVDLSDPKDGHPMYHVSDDPAIDAAVIVLNANALPQTEYDWIPIRLDEFATAEETQKFGIGDSVVSAGLVPGISGEKRNFPYFKFGAISNIFDEPFPTHCLCPDLNPCPQQRLERVWFIGANLVAGNSGSPILFLPTGVFGGTIIGSPKVQRPVLIGLQSSSIGSADIAAMTPVGDIFSIIEHMNLKNANLYRGEIPKAH